MSRDPADAPTRAPDETHARPTHARPTHAPPTHEPPHDHGGCLCDHPPTEAEATPDHALPEATGGVAGGPLGEART